MDSAVGVIDPLHEALGLDLNPAVDAGVVAGTMCHELIL